MDCSNKLPTSARSSQHFCSDACGKRDRRRKVRAEAAWAMIGAPSTRVCEWCGQDPFYSVNYGLDRRPANMRFCSRKCQNAAYDARRPRNQKTA